jgi:putative phage-type endonuclease
MITEEQRERRRKHIGASDVAAILGFSPWTTPGDVWLSKVEGIDKQLDEAMSLGNDLEPVILNSAERTLQVPLERDVELYTEGELLGANLDGRTPAGEPVEAKTAGILGPNRRYAEWGEEWSADIPKHYYLQIQAQMLVCGAERGFLPAMIGGRGIVMYHVPAHEQLHRVIRERCEAWWTKYVDRKTPPPEAPTLEIVKRIPIIEETEPKKVPSILFDRFLLAKDNLAAATNEKRRAEAALRFAMKGHKKAESDSGTAVITTINRKESVTKAHQQQRLTVKGKAIQ